MKRITKWHKHGNTNFWPITVARNWRVNGRNPITWLWTRFVWFRSRPWWHSAGRRIVETHTWSLITSWCARNDVIEAWDREFQVRTNAMTAIGRSPKFCDTIAASGFKIYPPSETSLFCISPLKCAVRDTLADNVKNMSKSKPPECIKSIPNVSFNTRNRIYYSKIQTCLSCFSACRQMAPSHYLNQCKIFVAMELNSREIEPKYTKWCFEKLLNCHLFMLSLLMRLMWVPTKKIKHWDFPESLIK